MYHNIDRIIDKIQHRKQRRIHRVFFLREAACLWFLQYPFSQQVVIAFQGLLEVAIECYGDDLLHSMC